MIKKLVSSAIRILRHNILLVLTAVLFIIIILLYIKFKFDEKIFLGLIGSVATVYFGILKINIEHDKIFKELFNSFNEKYDFRFNNLLNKLKNNPKKKLTKAEKNIVIDYFNLCAEEYLWRRKGRLPDSVWDAWKAGIKENLKIHQIEELFNDETRTLNGKMSYYGLCEELKR